MYVCVCVFVCEQNIYMCIYIFNKLLMVSIFL